MSTPSVLRVRPFRLLMIGAVAALAACGGSSESGDVTEGSNANEAEVQADDVGAANEQDAVDVARAGVDAGRLSQIDLADGGVIVAGMDCIDEGTGVLIVGARGMEPGAEIEMELDPSANAGQMFGQPDGTAYSAYQSGYDQFSYTLSFPGIDGGVEVSIQGCG